MKVSEMELLLRVAEAGSMTQAARQVHLTPAAVSAGVQRVERELGLRIFDRTTRAVRATAEGRVVLDGCREVVASWRHAIEEAHGARAEVDGIVHLSAPQDTCTQVLLPVLASLREAHPGLTLRLRAGDEVVSLQREAVDLAIRYGRLENSALTARALAKLPAVLVASPAYLEAHGIPRSPSELVAHRHLTLRLGGSWAGVWRLHRAATGEEVRVPLSNPLGGDGLLTRQWALAGQGIALKSVFDVIDDLEAGRLVRVLPAFETEVSAISAVFPSRRYPTARVRVVFEAIKASVATRGRRCDAWLASARKRDDVERRPMDASERASH